ncbi:MAG: hypothetical protein P9M03_10645 [Candidatus Theseobacter exili]|nr:hypothetical protein [Candidatus Theseobacter exili]
MPHWVIGKEVEGNTKKPLISFSEGDDEYLKRQIEKAWLLWKLDRKDEARNLTLSLLEKYADNTEILEFAVMTDMETGDYKQALQRVQQLESLLGPARKVLKLKADLYIRQKKWRQAAEIIEGLQDEYPLIPEMQSDYAYTLSMLKRWPESVDAYQVLRDVQPADKDFIWTYREALIEGSASFSSGLVYFYGPGSLRRTVISEDITFWPLPVLRAFFDLSGEWHKRNQEGDLESIGKSFLSHKMKGEWFINEWVWLSGHWNSAYLDRKDFNEIGISAEFRKGLFRSGGGYTWDHLIRDPIEGLKYWGKRDRFYWRTSLLFFEKITIGHAIVNDRLSVDAEKNQINGESSLGDRDVHDFFTDLTLLKDPFLSVGCNYRYAHWDKAFVEANQLMDFIENERAYSLELYAEKRFLEKCAVSAGITRNNDRKRKIWSTYSFGSLDWWIMEKTRLSMLFEYNYGDSGTSGSGDSQVFSLRVKSNF